MLSRRSILMGAAALPLGACASVTNPTTGVVTYGLDPTVAAFIAKAVAKVAQYAPTVESIAATAASLFGAGYGAIVTAGSAAVNTVIAALTNLVTNLPVAASARLKASVRQLATAGALHGALVGYTQPVNGKGGGVPVYAQ
jgi:hypothetical protein